LSAGLLVTKGGTKGAANEAVLSQLGNFPRALYMAAALCFVVGFLPGFPIVVFTVLAISMGVMGYIMQGQLKEQEERRAAEEAAKAEQGEAPVDPIQDMLKLDDLRLDLGSALVPLINSPDAALPGKVKSLRSLFIKDFGFVIPPVRIKDDAALPAMSYAISLHGVETARGELRPGAMMVIEPSGADIDIPGERTREPTFGLNAVWVDQSRASEAEARGMTVVDPESVVTTHLTEIIKEHMPELLTYAATQELVNGQSKEYQKLLSEVSNNAPMVLMQHVLQALMSERVSIRNLPKIIEAVAEAAGTTKNVQTIVEHVRAQLSKQICQNLTDETGYVSVVTLGQTWETELHNAVSKNGEETNFIMSPQRVQEFVLAVRQEIQQFANSDQWPALLVAPDSRPYVRSILERVSPMTQVISHNEVHRKASLKTVATIGGEGWT
jgi:flagellar biosynthesis protein FlhA